MPLHVFKKFREHLEEIQEAVEQMPCVVKIVPDIDEKLFLEACELLKDERMAKKDFWEFILQMFRIWYRHVLCG